MLKRIMAFSIICILLCGLAAGCGGDSGNKAGDTSNAADSSGNAEDSSGGGSGSSSASVDSGDEPIEISVATWLVDPEFLKQDDAIYNIVRDRFNITINPIVITWDDYTEKILT